MEREIKIVIGKAKINVEISPRGYNVIRNGKILKSSMYPKSQIAYMNMNIMKDLQELVFWEVEHLLMPEVKR